MSRNKKILVFVFLFFAAFAVLYWLTVPRSLSLPTMSHAADNIVLLDQALSQRSIDWNRVMILYDRRVKAFVSDTDRFQDNIKLDFTARDAIQEGKTNEHPEIPAVILRRTFLRAVLYHLEALMNPHTRPENTMTLSERADRVRVIVKPVLLFAGQESTAGSNLIILRITEWKAAGDEIKAQQFLDAVQGLFADAVLKRLDEWRKLPDKMKQDRLRALLLQADMRQLFHYLYPVHAQHDKKMAWRVLTEFANPPKEVDADLIEKAIRTEFGDKIRPLNQ
jgi:hypothetical protein